MTFQIFDFSDYRAYLNALLKSYPKKGHGVRSVWAQKMNCQIAYVSHVLNGLYDLSTEQGESLARHLGFNKEETEFFLLLIQTERAGTQHLKKFYRQLTNEILLQRENVRKRMKIKDSLDIEDQAIYYSNWLYAAVHMILTIPEYQVSPEKIATYFNTPLSKIREILEFLQTRNLVLLTNGRYSLVGKYLFINKHSPLFSNQQSFWRQKAIESIYQNNLDDIHFSSIFTVSESDLKKLKNILLKSVEDTTELINPSKEEKLYSICLDLFEVK